MVLFPKKFKVLLSPVLAQFYLAQIFSSYCINSRNTYSNPDPAPFVLSLSGQPVAGHEASQIVYQQGYPLGRQMYQSQHQMHPQGSQQGSYPYVMPLQYSGGPQQHYYVVQSQGDRAGLLSGQV